MLTAEKIDITEHFGLVHSIARKYKIRSAHYDDLIQEGCMGLMIAAERYDPERGAFTTYATFWIEQRIVKYLTVHADIVRMPHQRETREKYKAQIDELKRIRVLEPEDLKYIWAEQKEEVELDENEEVELDENEEVELDENEVLLRDLGGLRETICRYFGIGYERENFRELAKRYGITHQGVCDRINRAKKILKKMGYQECMRLLNLV